MSGLHRDAVETVKFAPRYDPQVLEAIQALDDPAQPIAETCRLVGVAAERLGFTRPSYVHLRRFVVDQRAEAEAERVRKAAIREIVADVAVRLATGRFVHAYEVADRVRRAGR